MISTLSQQQQQQQYNSSSQSQVQQPGKVDSINNVTKEIKVVNNSNGFNSSNNNVTVNINNKPPMKMMINMDKYKK